MALLALAAGRAAQAEPFYDDPYNTDGLVQSRTPHITDPRGRDCGPPAGKLTFADAVELALCRNPATRSAWAQVRLQAALVGEAEAAWSPSIVATDTQSRITSGLHADPSGAYVSTPQNSRDAALTLSWTVYDFGARTGSIASARSLLDAATATASSTAQQLVYSVVQAYYGFVASVQLLDAAKLAEANYAYVVEIAGGLNTGGLATLGDVLQTKTALDEAVLQRVQAEGALESSRGTLGVTLGLRADEKLELSPDGIPKDIPALGARVAGLIDEAIAQRPDLAAARAQRDAAEANVTVARAAGLPNLSLGVSRNWQATSSLPNQSYNMFGLTLTVPVFKGWSVSYDVRRAQAALEASEANVEQVRLGVTRDVWNGYYGLDSANKQLTASAELLKTADENREVAVGRYKAGVGSVLDILTAESARLVALQQRIQAELNWQVSRAQFVLALGVLYNAQPLGNPQLPSLP